VINFSGNITDETELLSANITHNLSGVEVWVANFTNIGATEFSLSNVTALPNAGVFNFTIYATDTSNNVKQNSTLITVTDNIFPVEYNI